MRITSVMPGGRSRLGAWAAAAPQRPQAGDGADRLLLGAAEPVAGGVPSTRVDAFVRAALRFEGQRYVWGGGHVGRTFTQPGGVDCSGLVQQAARMAGFNLDGTAAQQQDRGRAVGLHELRRGDLLFHGDPASHVGIYIGNGKAIHASSARGRVVIVDVKAYGYFDRARRIFDAPAPAPRPTPRPARPRPVPAPAPPAAPAPLPVSAPAPPAAPALPPVPPLPAFMPVAGDPWGVPVASPALALQLAQLRAELALVQARLDALLRPGAFG